MERIANRIKRLFGFSAVAAIVLLTGMAGCKPAGDALETLGAVDESAAQESKAVPIVKSVTPAAVLANGGTLVTIAGDHFTTDTRILFDETAAKSVEYVNKQSLRVVTPALTPGLVSVVPTNGPDGDPGEGALIAARLGVSPPIGPLTGGTTITIFDPVARNTINSSDTVLFAVLQAGADPTDAGFVFATGVARVDVAADAQHINNNLITAVTPPHDEGQVSVFIASDSATTYYVGEFSFDPAVPADGGPRLVSALSTSNTTVMVTFSEASRGHRRQPAQVLWTWRIIRSPREVKLPCQASCW